MAITWQVPPMAHGGLQTALICGRLKQILMEVCFGKIFMILTHLIFYIVVLSVLMRVISLPELLPMVLAETYGLQRSGLKYRG